MNASPAIQSTPSAEPTVVKSSVHKNMKWAISSILILVIGFLAYVNLSPDESRAPTTLVEQCIFNAGVNLNKVSIPETPIPVSASLSIEKLFVCLDSMDLQTTPQPDDVRVLVGIELERALTRLSEPDAVPGGLCLTIGMPQQIVVTELGEGRFVQIRQPRDRCQAPISI